MTQRLVAAVLMVGLIAFGSLTCVGQDQKKVAPKGYYDMESAQAAAMLERFPTFVILDIRTPKEFAAGHLKGAKNIDFFRDDFGEKLKKLDKPKGYLVHCASGGRSGRSMKQFKQQGFTTIYHISDGYKGWVASKLPVVK